ncbi:MAG TPA: ABC transporter permease [Micromonosporaceae bacterium]
MVLPRVLARTQESAGRVAAVTSRNLTAVRHRGYWLVVISGLAEPVLYLFSIGIGVGGLIDSVTMPDGTVMRYAAFVAPAMLAASTMTGAMAESTFNFFAKMKWTKLYDAVVATPVRPFEVALGELAWALARGWVYAAAFLALIVALDLSTIGMAVLALPAALLVGIAFGSVGMAIATTMRTWQDFDYLSVLQFSLFLFSGTFVPVTAYGPVLQAVVEVTPLYHSVELLRDITTDRLNWTTLVHVGYLIAMTLVGLAIASRRINKLLCK